MRLAALSLAGVLAMTGLARADNYEVFIEIETEEDLYDLLANSEISEETFNTLLPALQRGIDLNSADRTDLYTLPNLTLPEVDKIIAYREEAGWIADPAVLSINGMISERKLLAIAPFLIVRSRARAAVAVDGLVRTQTRWSSEDSGAPPGSLLARARTLDHLQVGFAGVVHRNRLSDVVYDPNRDALVAEPQQTRFEAVKGYAYWSTDDYDAIIGSYRIGFGQRLTFDNTSRTLPNGIRPDDELTRSTDLSRRCKESRGELIDTPCDTSIYTSPDFRWTERLLGVAAGAKQIPAGPGIIQAYGFASFQPKSIYQYEIYDRGRCTDPTDDDDPNCSAPQVYKRQDDPLAPTSRFSFMTLPDVYRETVIGGNVSYFLSPRMHVGVTGYGAQIDWLTDGIDLDFQEWSRTPYGGGFGAVGMDFAWGSTEWLDVFGEFTQTVDSQDPDGNSGGAGGILRGVGTWNKSKNELELSLRAYGEDFANPFARPISAADEFDGLRARDEVGTRLKFTGRPDEKLHLRTTVDLWNTPSEEQTAVLAYLRADYHVHKRLRLGGWTQFQDKGLGVGGRDQCFEISVEENEAGEPIPCSGVKYQFATVGRYELNRDLWFSGQARISLLDDDQRMASFRQDLSVWAIATWKPAKQLRLRTRLRYNDEDLDEQPDPGESDDRGERTLWTYIDATWTLPRKYRVRLRYDYFQWLDDRTTTMERTPNPEHWMWLELEAKF